MPALPSRMRGSPEEAFLFNPAFLGSITYEFVKTYSKERTATPVTLVAVGLSAALHKNTRSRLPYSTVSSLYGWLQGNEDLLVGFAGRTAGLVPYVKRGLIFALNCEVLDLSGAHSVAPGKLKANFPAGFLQDSTYETRDIVDRVKFLARWFAKSGSESTIMAAWGVKP